MITRRDDELYYLDPPITEAEILSLQHKPEEHIGASKHFPDLLKLLLAINAFGKSIPQKKVPFLMYEHGQYYKPTPSQETQGKKGLFYPDRRFQQICFASSKGSFTQREGQYFHDIFRLNFGSGSADLISVESLILDPIKDNLRKVILQPNNSDYEHIDLPE